MMRKFGTGMLWGEGLRWQNGTLWLSDTQGGKLWSSSGGSLRSYDTSSISNGLWFLPDGRLVAAITHEQRIGVWNGSDWDTYADLSHLDPGPLGDLIGDKSGNLYVDDVAYSMHKGEAPRPGRLIAVGADCGARVVAESLQFPNGLAFIDDEATLIVVETTAKCLTAFSVGGDGALSERHKFADLAALVGPQVLPDGICATAQGVWVATLETHSLILVSSGKLLQTLDTGTGYPIACCVDEGGSLFATIADTRGLPLMEAIASKQMSTDVFAFDLDQDVPV